MGGKNSGYIMGPLEAAGGAGLTALVPGGGIIGVPMMTAGLGTTVGQAAGGSKGAGMGGLIGGAAGGLGEAGLGFGGMGPLAKQLGPGGSWLPTGTGSGGIGSTFMSNLGLGGTGATPTGTPGSSIAAGVTPTPAGAPGAFPAPGAPATPEGTAFQAMSKLGLAGDTGASSDTQQMAQGFADYFAGNPNAHAAVAAATGATGKTGLSDTLSKAGDVANVAGAVSKVAGGGKQQQQQQPGQPPKLRQVAPVQSALPTTPTVVQVPTPQAVMQPTPAPQNYTPV